MKIKELINALSVFNDDDNVVFSIDREIGKDEVYKILGEIKNNYTASTTINAKTKSTDLLREYYIAYNKAGNVEIGGMDIDTYYNNLLQ